MDDNKVILKCIKEQNRLRIKIINLGYYNEANCQFPKNIREEGRYYSINPSDIILVTRTNKYFYKIKKTNIKILENFNENDLVNQKISDNVKIYEDENCNDCCICLDEEKNSVFIPCGHFYCCLSCSKHINKCPICRIPIMNCVDKKLFD